MKIHNNETTTAASTTVAWPSEELSALNGATKSKLRLATARKLNANKGSGIGGDVAQQVGAPFKMKSATVRDNAHYLASVTQLDTIMPGLLARLDAGEFDLMPSVIEKAAVALRRSPEDALDILQNAIDGATSSATSSTPAPTSDISVTSIANVETSETQTWSSEELSSLENCETKAQQRFIIAQKLSNLYGMGFEDNGGEMVGAQLNMPAVSVEKTLIYRANIRRIETYNPNLRLFERVESGELDPQPQELIRLVDALVHPHTNPRYKHKQERERQSDIEYFIENCIKKTNARKVRAEIQRKKAEGSANAKPNTVVSNAVDGDDAPCMENMANTLTTTKIGELPMSETPQPLTQESTQRPTIVPCTYETVPISSLTVLPELQNLFHCDQDSSNAMLAGMKADGYYEDHPVLVGTIPDEDGYIVYAGHTRLAKWSECGHKDIPVAIREFASKEDIKRQASIEQMTIRKMSMRDIFNGVAMYMPAESAAAKLRQGQRSDTKTSFANAKNVPATANEAVASRIGISPSQVALIVKIQEHGDKELLERVFNEELSLRAGYDQITGAAERKAAAKASGSKVAVKVEHDADIGSVDLSDDPPPPPVVNEAPSTKGAGATNSAPANAPAAKDNAAKTTPAVKSGVAVDDRAQCPKCVKLELFLMRVIDEIEDRGILERIMNSASDECERDLIQKQIDQLV